MQAAHVYCGGQLVFVEFVFGIRGTRFREAIRPRGIRLRGMASSARNLSEKKCLRVGLRLCGGNCFHGRREMHSESAEFVFVCGRKSATCTASTVQKS